MEQLTRHCFHWSVNIRQVQMVQHFKQADKIDGLRETPMQLCLEILEVLWPCKISSVQNRVIC